MKSAILLYSLAIIISTIPAQAADNPAAWQGPNTLTMPKQDPVIDSRLENIMSSFPADSSIAVWVFFTDKGIFDSVVYREKLDNAAGNLTPAALERRRKSRGEDNLVDFKDIPVSPAYVDQVLATGTRQRHILNWFNAVSVEATQPQVEMISVLPFVRYIKKVAGSSSNIDVSTSPVSDKTALVTLDYGVSYDQLEQINVVAAHELGFKGQNVIVCMMDTGFRQWHDAFQNIINSGRLLAQYDFINNDSDTDYDPSQDVPNQPYHGSLTWSTLGGEASGHLYGPAYMAEFLLSKTEDITSETHIEEDNWAAGAQWADNLGAQVISASLGYRIFDSGQGDYSYLDLDGNTTIVSLAADQAVYNGIAVATAMGNEGNTLGSLIAPADCDSVISCGAVDYNRVLATFSSWGPTSDGQIKPEVCAQGVYTACVDPYNPSNYTYANGTSLSTPLVGGACAVLLSAHPNWTPMMVREALMMTADRFDTPDNDYGWGILDAGRALYYHPAGDIIFDLVPVLVSPPSQTITIDATITGGSGIASALLYYRVDGAGNYIEVAMSTSNGIDFSGQIPGQTGTSIQYYLKATDTNGSFAFYPIGGDLHPVNINLADRNITATFEDGPGLWKTSGTNDFWGISARYAHGGNLSISDSPTINYRDNTDSHLVSTFGIDLTGASGAQLSFWYKGSISSGDLLTVEISSDGGINWTPLPQTISGSFLDFTQYSADLSSWLGQPDNRLGFHFTSNASGNDDGIYIDDISVTVTTDSIPTLSQWGMILLSLLLLAFISAVLVRRRNMIIPETD